MTIEVIQGTSDKPAASDTLAKALRNEANLSGCLFIGYPIIGTAEGQHRIDALLVSRDHGVVIFDLVEGSDPGQFGERQDDSANKLDARLRIHRELVSGRNLRIDIHTISFAPAAPPQTDSDHRYCGLGDNLVDELSTLIWHESDEQTYKQALSVIENVSSIRRAKVRRTIRRPQSRGAKLTKLEQSIATLDREQNRAVIETVEGVQRIRGLAGSGKTIVLALKAAYLHAQHPDWRIAVTFHTRSLKDIFRRFIEDFHLDQTNEPPDWDKVRIVNAWGSRSDQQPGLCFEFCTKVGTRFMNFRDARAQYGQHDAFAGACKNALGKDQEAHFYDAILVDEAQDFPPEFLRLCRAFLKDPRRLVYAYDELQNLERDSLPSPETIFGTDPNRTPMVALLEKAQDIVLGTCYRNPGPVLTVAHALGFGVYRTPTQGLSTGLVQMFDNTDLWKEVGYRVHAGELRSGKKVTLARSSDSSPSFLSDHSMPKDLVRFRRFQTDVQQDTWLARQICENLKDDELRPNDILVVHPEPYKTKARTASLRANLLELGVRPYLAGVEGHADVFWPGEDSVVFSSVHRAKGNEAAMVYVMDAQECQSSAINLAGRRNRLFAAITRSKAWVRVVGVGRAMAELEAEYDKVIDNEFRLRFRYPTTKQLKTMRIAHRDRTDAEIRRVETGNKQLTSILAELDAGNVSLSDLDPDVVAKLRRALKASP